MSNIIQTKLSDRQKALLLKACEKRGVTPYKLIQASVMRAVNNINKDCVDDTDITIADGYTKELISQVSSKADGRQVSDVVLICRDPYGKLPAKVTSVHITPKRKTWCNDRIQILDVCLKAILVKAAKKYLKSYGIVNGVKGLANAMLLLVSRQKEEDAIGYEINQEFEDLISEASAQEAIERTQR